MVLNCIEMVQILVNSDNIYRRYSLYAPFKHFDIFAMKVIFGYN